MKPYKKRLLTAALWLIVVGVVIAGIGYAITRGKKGDTIMENQSYAIADVQSIQINTDTPNVIITPMEGDQMNLSWQTDDYVEYEAALENGVLSISYRISSNWLKAIFVTPFAHSDYILEIELPGSYSGDIGVQTVSGKIIADTSAALDDCSLKSVSGVISAANITSKKDVALRSTSGSITADTIRADGGVLVQTVSGGISVNKADAAEDVSVKTTSGKAELNQITAAGNLSLDSVSGSLNLTGMECAAFTAKSVSGKIRLEGATAQSFVLKSTSGSIKGSITGAREEYAISVSTVSGGSNLKNTQGDGKTLKISTVSGGIDIQFDGN